MWIQCIIIQYLFSVYLKCVHVVFQIVGLPGRPGPMVGISTVFCSNDLSKCFITLPHIYALCVVFNRALPGQRDVQDIVALKEEKYVSKTLFSSYITQLCMNVTDLSKNIILYCI